MSGFLSVIRDLSAFCTLHFACKQVTFCVQSYNRFSDLGIVGALGIKGDVLILFSLSCRALGRDVDKKMAEFTFDKYQIKEILFKSTGKNEEVKTLLLEFLSGNGMNYSKST